MKARSAAIITQQNQILLVHRQRNGLAYFTLPGGGVENGESPGDACIREAKEETGLDVVIRSEVATFESNGRLEHYFYVDQFEGITVLGGPEGHRNNEENSYTLTWVSLDKLEDTDLRPQELKQLILDNIDMWQQPT